MNKQIGNVPVGMLVRSKAGHDKDCIYAIIRKEGTTVYVANGDTRSLKHPKRKNPKHLQVINCVADIEKMNDVQLKRHIKQYLEEEECQKQM